MQHPWIQLQAAWLQQSTLPLSWEDQLPLWPWDQGALREVLKGETLPGAPLRPILASVLSALEQVQVVWLSLVVAAAASRRPAVVAVGQPAAELTVE